MKRITCEDCKRTYDYDKDEFCPRCGAYNRPDNTWGVDAKGNVIRVDGVNERDHAGSFVHRELHHEKDVRKRAGMDWQPPKAAQRPQAARPQPVFRDTPQPERRGTPPGGAAAGRC